MKIAVITGTRAEFGIWTPVLHALASSKSLKTVLIATGMHLQKQFGHTIKQVLATSPVPVVETPMYKSGDTPADSLARGTANLAKVFQKLKPNLVMVLGDRLEILAAANAALACQIPLAHVHGGETAPGQWDEQIRHAVTKIAHLHFCATKTAAARIRQMGEDPKSIHVVGAPALDYAWIARELLGRPVQWIRPMLVLHPSSQDESLEYRRTTMIIDALWKAFPLGKNNRLADRRILALGPNNDPGHAGILRAYHESADRVALNMSEPQDQFWTHLVYRGLLVGNSSAGIIEAATFGVPVINIGDRQAGRERSDNVIDVPWNATAIRRALKKVTTDKAFQKTVAKRRNIYGDGHASLRILRILESLARKPIPLTKRFHDQ